MTLVLADWSVRIVIAGVIIWRKRSPSAALAWLVVVAFIPVVGAILYVLIGENRLGWRRLSRHQSVAQHLESLQLRPERFAAVWQPPLSEVHQMIAGLAESVGAEQPLGGNAASLISDPQRLVEDLVRDIDAAHGHAHLLYYIFNEDRTARTVAEALKRAADRGLECRLLVDSVGSQTFLSGALCRELRTAGVHVEAALAVRPLRTTFSRLDLRNHRKIAVVDGQVGYTGSHNISNPIYPRRARFGAWVDATIRIHGPAVRLLQGVFVQDWYHASQEELTQASLFPELKRSGGNLALQVLPTGPQMDASPLLDVLLQALSLAREEIIFTTPYFVPEDRMLGALRSAALRGVRVVLVVPRYSDSPLAQAAGRSHYEYLLTLGIQIHEFKNGLLHSKTLTVDRNLVVIGSANLDVRSFDLNFEIQVIAYDTDFASQVRFLQNDYLNQSDQLDVASMRKRSFARRFADNTAKLLTPLL